MRRAKSKSRLFELCAVFLTFGLAAFGMIATAGATEPASGDIVQGAAQAAAPFTAGTPFSSGQIITVAVPANTAFANATTTGINVVECSAPNGVLPTSSQQCDGDTIQGDTIFPNVDGSFTYTSYQVFALPDALTLGESPGGVACGNTVSTECILYIGQNQLDFTQPHLWSQPFFIDTDPSDSGSEPGDGSPPVPPAAPNPSLSTVVASPTTVTADGVDSSTVTVTLLGADHVPVPGKSVTLSPSSGTAHVSGASPAQTDSSGQTTFTVTDPAGETVTFTAADTTDSVTLSAQPTVTFATAVLDPGHSSVVASPANPPADGTTATTVTVTLRDQASSPQPVAGQTVTLAGTGSAVITPAASPDVTNAQGQATFTATDTVTESVTFTATDVSEAEAVIPNTATVTFGTLTVSGSQSTLTATTPAPVGNVGTTAVVTLRSPTNSPVAGKSVDLSASSPTASVGLASPGSDITGADGQVSFRLTDSVAESVTLTATDVSDGITLTSQPSVTFVPGGSVSPATSTVTAAGTTAPADGVTKTEITVIAKDQFGDPVSGQVLTLTGSPSGNVVVQPFGTGAPGDVPGTTDGNGEAVFLVSDTAAEPVTFTVTDTSADNLVLSHSVQITFSTGPLDAAGVGTTVIANPTDPPADGTTATTITVKVGDHFGNPLPGKTIVLAALNGSSKITTLNGVTDQSGRATFSATDASAQTVTYQATDVTDNNTVLSAEAVVNFGGGTVTPPPACSSTPLSGTGSSFASPAILSWINDVSASPYCLSLNWASSNSGTGRYEFTNQTVDFAVSDTGYVGNVDTTPPSFAFTFIPIVAAGIAFMYNVPGLTSQLHLSSQTACRLLTGGITNWDDPAIAADNPGVTLPNEPVVPVTESDGAGTNYALEQWCIQEQPALWAAFVQAQESQAGGPTDGVAISPTSPNSNWPGIKGGLDDQSTTAVASDVANHGGAIGAVQVKYADDLGFGGSSPSQNVALVKNASGDYTAPTPVDVASGLAYATQQANGTFELNFNGIGPHVYNPSTFSYLLTPTTGWSPSKGRTMSEFVNYALTLGQQQAPSFGYASLGLSLEQYGIHAVEADVPGAVQPTAAEQAALACGGLTPVEVAAGQTTATCSGESGFGSGGQVTTDFDGEADGINAMAPLPDGDLVAGGYSLNPSAGEEAALAEYSSTGALDPTFGTGGRVAIDFNLGGNSAITALDVLPSGSILVGGYTYNPTLREQQSFVARVTPAGALDQTFATGGVYLTQPTSACTSSEVAAFAGLLGGDVAALVTCDGPGAPASTGSFAVLGLASNGSLDPLFGADGVTALNLPPDPVMAPFGQQTGQLNAPLGFMTETSQGLYVAAAALVNGQNGIALERVLSNGQIDPSFGTGGVRTLLPSDFGCATAQGSSTCPGIDVPTSITTQQQSNGSREVLIGGQDNETGRAAVLRLLPNGALDTGFGDGGVGDAGFSGPGTAITTQADGGILVGGTDVPTGAGADLMAIARLTRDGQLDSTFGNQGYDDIRFGSSGAQLTTLAVDASGDYVGAGATLTGPSSPGTVDFALTEVSGSPDPPSDLTEAPEVLAFPLLAMGAVLGWREIRRRRVAAATRLPSG
jgi:uncharacterized delta-60 repeat protein